MAIATPITATTTAAAPAQSPANATPEAAVKPATTAPAVAKSPVVKTVSRKSPAKKAATKQPAVKQAAAKKTPVKQAAVKKAVVKKAAPKKAATKSPMFKTTVSAKSDKAVKHKKPKLVRDSFTIPKAEYGVLDELKQRAGKLTRPAKKSELLRAGIKTLATLSDAAFLTALQQVPTIKTGRPSSKK
jgi:hypothetical protein